MGEDEGLRIPMACALQKRFGARWDAPPGEDAALRKRTSPSGVSDNMGTEVLAP